MEKIELKNVSYSYPGADIAAIRDISITIQKGEFIVIGGISGSGKSTLLKQLKPSILPRGKRAGEIVVDGVSDQSMLERLCGFVMQSPEDQFVTEFVWHELAFGLESLGKDTEYIRRKVAETASFFGMERIFGRKVTELSGGQKQLAALASIVAMDPEVLILDEPTSRLDPIAEAEFLSVLKRLNTELGMTVLLSAHAFDGLLPIASRLVIIDGGTITYDGTPEDTLRALYSDRHMMMQSMPAPSVVTAELGGTPALTVRDGMDFLSDYASKNPPVLRSYPVGKAYSDNPAVVMREVSFGYGENGEHVLRNLNLTVKKGEIFSLFGGNGAGKTTVLNLIADIIKPNRGKITVSSGENRVFCIPQDPRLMFRFETVKSELMSVGDESGIVPVAEKCGIDHLFTRHPYDISGGEQQKLAIALLMLHNADVFMLDEPTKGLDAVSKRELANLLKNLKGEGKTFIIASHDVEFCASVSDSCGLLFDGSVITQAATREFVKDNIFFTTSARKTAKDVVPEAINTEEILSAFGREPSNFGALPRENNNDLGKEPARAMKDLPIFEAQVQGGKRIILLLPIMAIVAVLTVVLGLNFITDRRFFVVTSLIVIECMAFSFMSFEHSRPPIGELVIIAVLCAVGVAGRAAFFAIPSFKPVLAVVIIGGVTLGCRAGFLVGALSMLISNFIFGQGIWTIYQMFAAGIIGCFAGLFKKQYGKRGFKLKICVFGALAAIFIYGAIVNPSYVLTLQNDINLSMLATLYATGLPNDVVHAFATAVFLWLGAVPIIRKIERAKLKYDI